MVKFACAKLVFSTAGENETLKIPISKVHHFNENTHNLFQVYKIDVGDGKVVHGTINFLTNTEGEMDEILEKGKRQQVLNKRYIIPARDTTDDSELEVQQKNISMIKKQQDVSENVSARLLKLKMKQAQCKTSSIETKKNASPVVKKCSPINRKDPLCNIDYNIFEPPQSKASPVEKSTSSASKKLFSSTNKGKQRNSPKQLSSSRHISTPSTLPLQKKNPTSLPVFTKIPLCTTSKKSFKEKCPNAPVNNNNSTLPLQTNSVINSARFKGMPSSSIDDISESLGSNSAKAPVDKTTNPSPDSFLNTVREIQRVEDVRTNTIQHVALKLQEPIPDNRLAVLKRMADEMDRDSSEKSENDKMKIVKLSGTLKKCHVRIQEMKVNNAELQEKWNETKEELRATQQQVAKMDEEMQNIKRLNEDWQRISITKCDVMHAIFSEWKASQNHSRTNVTYAPVGYVTENESHIHLGRGIWLYYDTYLLAISGIKMKTRKRFFRQVSVAVFGFDVLAKSTITGQGSNRNGRSKKPEMQVDPKKLLAIKDMYKFFCVEHFHMDPETAEMEAGEGNESIRKKISQLKELKSKPRKRRSTPLGGSIDAETVIEDASSQQVEDNEEEEGGEGAVNEEEEDAAILDFPVADEKELPNSGTIDPHNSKEVGYDVMKVLQKIEAMQANDSDEDHISQLAGNPVHVDVVDTLPASLIQSADVHEDDPLIINAEDDDNEHMLNFEAYSDRDETHDS